MNQPCTRDCVPSYENLNPNAEHYADCIIWDYTAQNNEAVEALRAHLAARGIGGDANPTPAPRDARTDRHAPLYASDAVSLVIGSSVLAVVMLLLFGAYVGWWS